MTVTIERPGAAPRRVPPRRAVVSGERLMVIGFGVFLFAVWEIGCRAFAVSELLLPPPSAILKALVAGFRSGLFVSGLQATLLEIVLGFLLAAVAAFVVGTLISQIRILETVLYPYVVALQTLPKVAIAPFVLIWVGFGVESKVVIAAMVAFFPILVNTIVG